MKNKIQQIRTEKKITQKELIEKTGIKQSMISHYELNNRNLSVDSAVKIAKVLKVSWWELYEQ